MDKMSLRYFDPSTFGLSTCSSSVKDISEGRTSFKTMAAFATPAIGGHASFNVFLHCKHRRFSETSLRHYVNNCVILEDILGELYPQNSNHPT